MDTHALELAAQRYRDAEAALDAARVDLQAQAIALREHREERGAQAQVARITGWTREYVRKLWNRADETPA